ncbi:velvet complex protein [Fonsecaea pedrosoi]|nr:velvet complex protein [Fonsecaea pedrosoi]
MPGDVIYTLDSNPEPLAQDPTERTEVRFRAIDPPPIVQLLMDDFDPDNEDDVAELKCPFWVVHCRLVGAVAVNSDVSTQSYYTEEGQKEVQRLLLGTTVASPTHTSDDPDPPTMPTHPATKDAAPAPPSPTSRFLPNTTRGRLPRAPHNIPGSFFIFADLSLRRAGEYRLQFTLMKMEPPLLRVGATVPAHHVVTSQVFRAVNAKDFDQVQPSTNLVKGLLDRGAGYPLKLKKGIREGQRRRRQQWDDYSDDEDSGDYDNE